MKCTVSVHVTPQNQAAEPNPAPPPLTARDTRRMLSRQDIEEVIVDAWLCQAPKRIAKAWLAERNEP